MFWRKPVQSIQQTMAGLSFSTEGVALCCVVPAAEQGYRLSHCLFEATASIRDAPQTLHRMIRQQGLQGTPCQLALAYNEYKIIRTEAPNVPNEELSKAVHWKIQDQIEQDPDLTIMDVFPLPESRQPGRPKTVCAVVADLDLIKQRISWVKESGLELQSISIPELALVAYTPLLPENEKGLLLIHQAEDTGVLMAARNDWMYLSRHVRLNQRPPELGLTFEAEPMDEALVLEIQRSMDYYESYFAENAITDLVITPSGREVEDRVLLTMINRELAIEARTLDMTAVFETQQPLDDVLQSHCLVAAGMALTGLAA